METLQLSRELVNIILKHTQSSATSVKGLIFADHQGEPCATARLTSGDADKLTLQDAIEHARARHADLQPFALYTSYPDQPPIADDSLFCDSPQPELLHVLISLDTKGVLEMRGWRKPTADAAIQPVKLMI